MPSGREGQAALAAPSRTQRQAIRVLTPCVNCSHSGVCAIEEQIEDNLVLEIISIGRPVDLELLCSEFEESDYRKRPRITWSETRRTRFMTTIAEKRRLRTVS